MKFGLDRGLELTRQKQSVCITSWIFPPGFVSEISLSKLLIRSAPSKFTSSLTVSRVKFEFERVMSVHEIKMSD